MTRTPAFDLIKKAAAKAIAQPYFLANALSVFQKIHRIGNDGLASFLECSEDDLPRVALCRKPDPSGIRFRQETEQIAGYAGINSLKLAQLLRQVDSYNALLARPAQQSELGLLMAARDKIGKRKLDKKSNKRKKHS